MSSKINASHQKDLRFVEVRKILHQIKPGKSAGPDGITPFLLRVIRFYRSPAYLHNKFELTDGDLSEAIKTATVILIPRTDQLETKEDWRTISLLTVFSKGA